MKKYKILVTGVGAIIGYGIIHSLRKSKYNPEIIGIDIYDDAIGRVWCDLFKQGVLAVSPEFPSFLIGVIQTYGIDLVIPGIEQDVMSIAVHFDTLKGPGAIFAINSPEVIHLFHDKWLAHQFLCTNGIEAIRSYCDGDYDVIKAEIGSTMLAKPRHSYASKGIQLIKSAEDFYYWKHKLGSDFMVQEIIGDDEHEYTIAVFGLGDGSYCDIIMLRRKLAVDGSTVKAWSFYDERAEDVVKKICSMTKPVGPTNFQLRYHKGVYYLLEVNPRISSTTSIRQALGYNEAEMCIEYFLEHKTPKKRSTRSGSAIRYIADHVIYDSSNR